MRRQVMVSIQLGMLLTLIIWRVVWVLLTIVLHHNWRRCFVAQLRDGTARGSRKFNLVRPM